MAGYYAPEELEPVATEEEYRVYESGLLEEEKEEEMLVDRFERAVQLDEW